MEEEKSKAQEAAVPWDSPAAGLQQGLLRLDFKGLTLRKSLAPSCLSVAALSPSSSSPSTPAREDHQHAQLSTSKESSSQVISQGTNKGQEDLL